MKGKRKGIVRYMLILVGLLLIVAVVGKNKGWFGKPDSIDVVVEQPQRRTIIETVTANGKVHPVVEVKISPEVSGEIIELPVKEGQMVSKGDLLCRIKPDTYVSMKERAEAAVKSAQARLAQAKAQLAQAELSHRRGKQLFEQNAISSAEFEEAQTSLQVVTADVQAAEFNVESSQASLREAIENLSKTTIYAPISGTISRLSVEPGERVVGTAQMAGTEILRIADLTRMEARVDVNENDIVRVKHNDTTLIDIDAYPTRTFKGVVTQIANSASVAGSSSDQVTTFEVRILMLPESYQDLLDQQRGNPFRPGMSTNVDIQTQTNYNVLCVPILAVTTRSDSIALGATSLTEVEDNQHQRDSEPSASDLTEVVFVAAGDTAQMVMVTTGIQDNQYIEITDGIAEEQEVIVAPFGAISRHLSHGALINRVTHDDLFSNR